MLVMLAMSGTSGRVADKLFLQSRNNWKIFEKKWWSLGKIENFLSGWKFVKAELEWSRETLSLLKKL